MKEALKEELDQLSLTQALVDSEMATARVIDLTERLVDARQQLVRLRTELEHLRIDYTQYRAEQERVQLSPAYRLATKLCALRDAFKL